ncbi:MAG: hypothetical protein ACLR23_06555 [Clostridia bacterium]
MDIAGDTDHIDHTLAFRQEIGFEIASPHICHNSNFHIRDIVANNGADMVFDAEFPLSKVTFTEHIFARLVPKFHIVYAAFNVYFIEFCHEFVRKLRIIAKIRRPYRQRQGL